MYGENTKSAYTPNWLSEKFTLSELNKIKERFTQHLAELKPPVEDENDNPWRFKERVKAYEETRARYESIANIDVTDKKVHAFLNRLVKGDRTPSYSYKRSEGMQMQHAHEAVKMGILPQSALSVSRIY